jgi:hypothetical protein
MGLQKDIDDFEKQKTKIKDHVRELINSAPDNPVIKRTSKNTFMISFSEIGENLTPFYHDNLAQAIFVHDLIDGYESLNQISLLLKEIVDTGVYRYQNTSYKFNQYFRDYLKEII